MFSLFIVNLRVVHCVRTTMALAAACPGFVWSKVALEQLLAPMLCALTHPIPLTLMLTKTVAEYKCSKNWLIWYYYVMFCARRQNTFRNIHFLTDTFQFRARWCDSPTFSFLHGSLPYQSSHCQTCWFHTCPLLTLRRDLGGELNLDVTTEAVFETLEMKRGYIDRNFELESFSTETGRPIQEYLSYLAEPCESKTYVKSYSYAHQTFFNVDWSLWFMSLYDILSSPCVIVPQNQAHHLVTKLTQKHDAVWCTEEG